ncbi:MAG: sodium/proline symporter [Pseudomonadales bacterium]|nr:sodium/proline symporter [Pseudomonadales bacterium]NIX07788.1 sodium/proline symporter [Pseudomonadales bacterium]
MSNTGVILTTLVAYKLALVAIGWWARGRTSDNEAFFIGGRGLGAWVASLSYAAGSSSAWSILGVSGIAFSQGIGAVWLLPGTLTGHVLVWFWLGRRLQSAAAAKRWVTLNDLIVDGMPDAFRRAVLLLAAGIIGFAFLFYIAAQFQGAANTFAEVFAVDFTTSLLIGATVVLAYTLLGGFWAVSVTDAVQAVLMLFASLLIPVLAIVELGGMAALGEGLTSVSTARQMSLTDGNAGWLAVGFVIGMWSIGVGPLGQPHLLNRLMALKDARAFRRARVIAMCWFVIVLAGMFLAGLAGHVLIQSVADPERLLFTMTDRLLDPILAGIVVAAVLSAIMSTADSQLLVAAAAVSHDLLRRGSLALSRVVVVILGGLAVGVALYLPEAIFSRVLFAWTALGAAFGPLVIARVLGWRVRPWAAFGSLATGFLLTAAFHLLPDTVGDVVERAVPFLASGAVVAAGRGSRDRQGVC